MMLLVQFQSPSASGELIPVTPDPLALLSSCPPVVDPIAMMERPFPADPASVPAARRFAKTVLADVADTDADHAYDVTVVVSELVTNAIQHAEGVRNVFVRV